MESETLEKKGRWGDGKGVETKRNGLNISLISKKLKEGETGNSKGGGGGRENM